MKVAVSAIAALIAMTVGASAACNVTGNIVTFTLSGNLNESDCASSATVAAQGVSIANLQASDAAQGTAISGLQATVATHTSQIGTLQTSDSNQNAAIILNYAWDGAQQAQINVAAAKNAQQDGRLTDVEDKNDEQDDRLNKHRQAIIQNYKIDTKQQKQIDQQGKAIAYNYAWDWAQQKQINNHSQRIGSLEDVTATHDGRLNAHDALLSDHSARLDEHAKGLAIAMAMPDAWLSDRKRFGIFGAVGGFEGETALGFAAIGRINETWSVNAKLGADTEFDRVGWQVGVGAQW